MKSPTPFALAFALIAALAAPAWADSTIVILRHGEKPARGLGQLNCQGLNRALALAPLLLARYGKPTAIHAPDPAHLKKDLGVPYAYIRPLATVEPLAIRAGLPVSLEGGMADIDPLAAKLLAASDGTHIVAWEHHWAESLARLLLSRAGGDPAEVPAWEEADFDSLYVIRIGDGPGGRRASFSHEHQGLDGLPATCSDGPLRHPRHDGERTHESTTPHP